MNTTTNDEWSLSEKTAFKELKSEIEEEFGPDAADDDKIKRFLIARNFDVYQAYLMLRKNLIWRKKNNVDTILQDYERSEVFVKYFPLQTIGFDKEDRPLILTNFGDADPKGFIKTFTKAEILRNLMYYLEMYEQQIREQSKATGKHIDKWTVVANMEGFSFQKFSNKILFDVVVEALRMYEGNYPERLNVAHAVNSPTSVQLLFSFVKPFISTKTLQKIIFYGNNKWKEVLLEHIDPSVLPAYLGGERTDDDGNPGCYSIVNYGGNIPEEYFIVNSENYSLKNHKEVKVQVLKRNSKMNLPLNIEEEGSVIEWDIEIDNYDIAFELYLGSLVEKSPIIPLHKLESRETGAIKCETPGIYNLLLDNSYSFFRSKKIYYKVSVIKPEERRLEVEN